MHLQLVGSCRDPSSPKHAIAAAVEMTHPSNVLPSALGSKGGELHISSTMRRDGYSVGSVFILEDSIEEWMHALTTGWFLP